MVKKPGFSLIELIVVIGLLSLLMLAISGTMLMSIVSSNRIRTTTKIKQAGNYALGQIQGMIRSAKSIETCYGGDETSSITLVNPDGNITTITSEIDEEGQTRIASNSATYLTPANMELSLFTLSCEPTTSDPSLIKVSFGLKDKLTTSRKTGNPTLHFETSINIRNE